MEAFYPLLALTAAMFLAFGVLSRPLQSSIVTAPMLCVLAGVSVVGPDLAREEGTAALTAGAQPDIH